MSSLIEHDTLWGTGVSGTHSIANRFAKRLGRFCLVGLFSIGLSACVGNDYPAAPSELPGDVRNYEYTIGSGDILNVFVWGYEELSHEVEVRPDGKVTTRLLEDMQASGKSPTQLARDLEQRYETFVNKPTVTISVNGFVGSRSQQVQILNAGEDAVSIPFSEGMTVLDLVISIGGIGEFASGNRTVLIRKQQGEEARYSLRLDDLVRKGDISANVPLLPGDVVLIPESRF